MVNFELVKRIAHLTAMKLIHLRAADFPLLSRVRFIDEIAAKQDDEDPVYFTVVSEAKVTFTVSGTSIVDTEVTVDAYIGTAILNDRALHVKLVGNPLAGLEVTELEVLIGHEDVKYVNSALEAYAKTLEKTRIGADDNGPG